MKTEIERLQDRYNTATDELARYKNFVERLERRCASLEATLSATEAELRSQGRTFGTMCDLNKTLSDICVAHSKELISVKAESLELYKLLTALVEAVNTAGICNENVRVCADAAASAMKLHADRIKPSTENA